MAKSTPPFTLPARLEVMRSFYTDAIVTAATRRVIMGDALPPSMKREEKKAALLLVRELNPDEILNNGEEEILRGVGDVKLKGHKDRGELPQVIGGIQPLNVNIGR